MLQNPPSIGVFFPAYNDEGSIEKMVVDALAVLPTLTGDYEVIVVNDGSSDATASVLEQLTRTSPFVKIIHHESNQGYGAALRTGFTHSCKDLIFYTDGDGQYDVRELVALLPLMTDDVDIVNGYKIRRADSRRRIILGTIYNRAARLFFSLPIRDVDCDFRLIRRRAIQQIQLSSSSGVICTEMVRKLCVAGYTFAETPVNHYPRPHGKSQFFTLRRVARTAYDFSVLWWKIVALRRLFPAVRALKHRENRSSSAAEQARTSSD
jgi:glycosyltransferase involved in cell wall biosynthesis